ncbi:hypothetical protein WA026_008752 [Henosepilachna vigintioctopunctata]|uniref:Uncharacterized protein n=1 Tax=Henosepilachna vigintioctopunctata TaxID=420089 RepID=A0AAW1VB45_9CUCU
MTAEEKFHLMADKRRSVKVNGDHQEVNKLVEEETSLEEEEVTSLAEGQAHNEPLSKMIRMHGLRELRIMRCQRITTKRVWCLSCRLRRHFMDEWEAGARRHLRLAPVCDAARYSITLPSLIQSE